MTLGACPAARLTRAMPATEKSFNAEPAGDGDFSSRIAVACRLGVEQTCAHVAESDSKELLEAAADS